MSFLLLLICSTAQAQIDQIKRESGKNSSGSSSRRGSGDSGGSHSSATGFWLALEVFRGIGIWQNNLLSRRSDIPSIVSLEIMPQLAIQPPNNYWLLPRVRGTWGLFSTDFRYNFFIEDAPLEGKVKSLGTFDWQIVQLNFVNTQPVTVRGGIGFMSENFGDHATFMETTLSTDLRFKEGKIGGGAEYRVASDYDTNVTPRREINARFEYRLGNGGRHLKSYVTLGGIFQRHYSTVNVWGIQAGMIFRIQ